MLSSRERHSVWHMTVLPISGIGTETKRSSSRAARTRSVRFNRRAHRSPSTGTSRSMKHSACRGWTTAFSPGRSPRTGAWPMGTRRVFLIAFAFALLIGVSALAQGPTYGVGRTPTAEEIRALDISIGPTGEELPPGKGTAKEGAQVYRAKGCAGCHGAAGTGGAAPVLKSKDPKNPDVWARGRILPLRAPFATTVWDYINRGMPLNREGTLTADGVYALTAYLLYINGVVPEDATMDAQRPPTARMPKI